MISKGKQIYTIIILLILVCTALISCGKLNDEIVIKDKQGYTITTFETYYFTKDKHDYILFKYIGSNEKSIVHNPDCKSCKKDKENTIEKLLIRKEDNNYGW